MTSCQGTGTLSLRPMLGHDPKFYLSSIVLSYMRILVITVHAVLTFTFLHVPTTDASFWHFLTIWRGVLEWRIMSSPLNPSIWQSSSLEGLSAWQYHDMDLDTLRAMLKVCRVKWLALWSMRWLMRRSCVVDTSQVHSRLHTAVSLNRDVPYR